MKAERQHKETVPGLRGGSHAAGPAVLVCTFLSQGGATLAGNAALCNDGREFNSKTRFCHFHHESVGNKSYFTAGSNFTSKCGQFSPKDRISDVEKETEQKSSNSKVTKVTEDPPPMLSIEM